MQAALLSAEPPAAARLRLDLCSETIAVREDAVARAARELPPEALSSWLGQREDLTLRNSAIAALERQGPYAVRHLLELARGADARTAMFAVQILARVEDPTSEGGLLGLLEHADQNLVQAAIEGLGRLRSRRAVPALLGFLGGETWLQFTAISALGQIGDERAVPALLALVDDDLLGLVTLEALGAIGHADAAVPLVEVLATRRELQARDAALRALDGIFARERPNALVSRRLRRLAAMVEPVSYLADVIAGDDLALARAAVRVTLLARIEALYPALFARVARSGDAGWTRALLAGMPIKLRGALASHAFALPIDVRTGALLTARFGPGAAPALLPGLDDLDARVREATCHALGRLADPAAVPALVALLERGLPLDRHAAAEALARMPGDALAPLGRFLAGDQELGVLLPALAALAGARAPLHERAVLALTGHTEPAVRTAALRALAAHPEIDAVPHLVAALADRDDGVAAGAVDLLAERGAAGVAPHLLELLRASGRRRQQAIRALGRTGAIVALPHLVRLLPGASPAEQVEITVAAARLGGDQALAFLRGRLGQGPKELRRAAADGLACHAGAGDLERFIAMADDEDWVVRGAAAQALARIGSRAAEEVLMRLCRDVESLVARAARVGLGRVRAAGAGADATRSPR